MYIYIYIVLLTNHQWAPFHLSPRHMECGQLNAAVKGLRNLPSWPQQNWGGMAQVAQVDGFFLRF